MKWQELAATSHYRTAVAVKQAIQEGEINRDIAQMELSWEDVFEASYTLKAG